MSMDPFILTDGSYDLQPNSRRLLASTDRSCEPVSECEACTTGQRDNESVCQDTGLVQRFKCMSATDQGVGDPKEEFRACKRTVADEEFLMMRMQVICFLFGSISLIAVRRQKGTAATLFDQRKAKRGDQNYDADGEDEIEFSPMAGQGNDEIRPLVPIDVV